MKTPLLALAALALSAPAWGKDAPSPNEIVDAAPGSDWVAIPASDLLVMDLAPDRDGAARRVVIQLMPAPFSQGWVGNIRKLAAAHWWDGTAITRVQDNYVVQWGDPNADDKAKAKPLPEGLATMTETQYEVRLHHDRYSLGAMTGVDVAPESNFLADFSNPEIFNGYPAEAAFAIGWPYARDGSHIWPIHCYGMVGVGRDMPPNTGSGAELYTVIGTPPRHLDRNIALVGRVIEGMEYLSSLPRGHGPLGFYQNPEHRVPIQSIRLGNEVSGLPAYQYLSTNSRAFAKYVDARANRRDPFFIRPAGGVDICNVPVPVRRVK